MIQSNARQITFQGKPATLYVIRNNGECWGRLVAGGEQFDVSANQDLYDEDDEWALDLFEEAAKLGSNVEPAISWL